MSPAEALLAELVAHGIEVQAHGERLRYHPKAAMTPELVQRVKAHKAELLALLSPATQSPHPTAPPTESDAVQAEWDRFLRVAREVPGIPGVSDAAELASPAGKALAVYLTGKPQPANTTPLDWEPERDENGMTAAERAEHWRRTANAT